MLLNGENVIGFTENVFYVLVYNILDSNVLFL